MKIKLSFKSVFTLIVLISIGIYTIISIIRVPVNPKAQNDSLESTDTNTKIDEDSNTRLVSPLTNDDFVIKDTNRYFELGEKYEELKTNDKILKTIPANENNIYDIYEYENFKLLTQPDGNSSSIIGIDLTTPTIQTSRGISVSNTVAEVVEKYGDPDDSIKQSQYIYQFNSKFITFFIDETGIVVLIRFEII